MYGSFPHQAILHFSVDTSRVSYNLILTLTIQRQCRPHRLRAHSHKTAPIQMPARNGVPSLPYFCLADHKFTGSHDHPCWCAMSLERLTELRKTLSLWLFYYEKCNSGTAKWKRYMVQGLAGRGREQSFCVLSECTTFPSHDVFTRKLSKLFKSF